jgi:hypothetical protein
MAGAGPRAVSADPDLPLPRWVYLPGRGNEPDRETLDRVKALVPDRFGRIVPAGHPALLYGLLLNDSGFFWECHEILEAVWKAAPQGGCDRILLRALIQIANANLKHAMDQPRAVARLILEAAAELDELAVRRPEPDSIAADYPAAALRKRLDRADDAQPITIMKQNAC